MAEGWYCPGCKAHHGPHVDTCPRAGELPKLGPAIAGWPIQSTPVVGIPMPSPAYPGPYAPNRIYCGSGSIAQANGHTAWNVAGQAGTVTFP